MGKCRPRVDPINGLACEGPRENGTDALPFRKHFLTNSSQTRINSLPTQPSRPTLGGNPGFVLNHSRISNSTMEPIHSLGAKFERHCDRLPPNPVKVHASGGLHTPVVPLPAPLERRTPRELGRQFSKAGVSIDPGPLHALVRSATRVRLLGLALDDESF